MGRPPKYREEVKEVVETPKQEIKKVEVPVEKPKEVDVIASEIVASFENRYDKKNLIIQDIERIKAEYLNIRKELETLTKGYDAQVRASKMAQADLDRIMKDKESIKAQISIEKKGEIDNIERIKSRLLNDQQEYDKLLKQAKIDSDNLQKGLSKLKQDTESLKTQKMEYLNSLESREIQIKTLQGQINNQISKNEMIKSQSDDAIKRLEAKQVELRKEQTNLDLAKEKLAKDLISLDEQRRNLDAEKARIEVLRSKREQEIVVLKEHYQTIEKTQKQKEADLNLRKLELDAMENKINKLVKKYQLEEELKK